MLKEEKEKRKRFNNTYEIFQDEMQGKTIHFTISRVLLFFF